MSKQKHILLIEDNADDERLTLRALRKHNVNNEIVVATDGPKALEYLLTSNGNGTSEHPLPALIVLDLNLPGMDGIEVLGKIRSHASFRSIPVVVMTSQDDSKSLERAYAAGANSFVRKPTAPDLFAETVLNMAMYWLLLNRTA